MNKGELSGKVAIVTGAAQGLGEAIAERFGEEEAVLVLVDIKSDKIRSLANELEKRGSKVWSQVCDVSDECQVHSLVGAIMRDLKHIDILVNSAGIHRTTRFHEMTVEEWDRVMNVNLRGTFLLMREVYPLMKENGDGRIVNFSSTAGLTVSNFGGAHYTASKHAVMGLTKAVAKEGGPFGIRVNAVCPGIIDTEMIREISVERVKQYENAIPVSKIGTPKEVAELVLFLVSDRSAYITGIGVNISGGLLI
jgi:NAD(P)-dependent dehydrogenase (short-subunit alcohol dehydrogenase family)